MLKILVVDDEYRIREIIKKYAIHSGYDVTEAVNGLQAISLCNRNEYDLIIMDVMMPELDGLAACREIRKKHSTPIIMLSAKGEEYDRLRGFELGVDDYVVKPFSPKELMMRISAIIKRTGKPTEEEPPAEFKTKGLTVDLTARIVKVNGERIDITPKEYELLTFMVKNRGVALTREKLISKVWGEDFEGDDRTLDTHIKLLRKGLGEYSYYISTLRGVGYRFDVPRK